MQSQSSTGRKLGAESDSKVWLVSLFRGFLDRSTEGRIQVFRGFSGGARFAFYVSSATSYGDLMQTPSVFQPPIRLLMGPGPSNVAPSVLRAMSAPLVGHLDPSFVKLMEEIKGMLRDVFLTRN